MALLPLNGGSAAAIADMLFVAAVGLIAAAAADKYEYKDYPNQAAAVVIGIKEHQYHLHLQYSMWFESAV